MSNGYWKGDAVQRRGCALKKRIFCAWLRANWRDYGRACSELPPVALGLYMKCVWFAVNGASEAKAHSLDFFPTAKDTAELRLRDWMDGIWRFSTKSIFTDMCWPEMHEACLRLLDLHDGVSLTAEDREMVALQYIRLAKNPYYWDWTILKRIIAHYLVEPGFLCIAHEGTLRWVRDFDKWDMRVDAQLGVPGLKAALARAYETKATACQESVVESPIAGSCGEWPCVADIIGMAPIPCVVHDGQVAIYALMGHDARIYYIGQARNPVARYAAHVTKQQSSTAPLFGPRASLHPQMKVLRWVKEEDAFRVEREAINHYIALGEPLVNDNRLWRDGADVIEACLTTD